ncbi:MAG: hypothetical protein GXO26_03680 [Crenarchaeota archaeon]|nr:hypothetical protein [Thermoproteota archaeon]
MMSCTFSSTCIHLVIFGLLLVFSTIELIKPKYAGVSLLVVPLIVISIFKSFTITFNLLISLFIVSMMVFALAIKQSIYPTHVATVTALALISGNPTIFAIISVAFTLIYIFSGLVHVEVADEKKLVFADPLCVYSDIVVRKCKRSVPLIIYVFALILSYLIVI